jgi:integrase/recombinase XerD
LQAFGTDWKEIILDRWSPCLVEGSAGETGLGHPLIDDYLELVRARARRNTLLAATYDLKVFFGVVGKDPLEVKSADVFAFVKAQRQGPTSSKVVRLADGSAGLELSTIQRRLSTVSGFYAYLVATEPLDRSPVGRGAAARTSHDRRRRPTAIVRPVRQLPRILEPIEVVALLSALRKWRDRAMIEAMVLGGLRRSEVLGLRFEDLRVGERRVLLADGKGGRQRWLPMSPRFFASVAAYLDAERPTDDVDAEFVFVVLKGTNRRQHLSPKGLEEILRGARERTGLSHATCHELRHTSLTRLREAGMALEAVQAQAGHRSIESTRVYLHLPNNWLANEYRKAYEAIDAQVLIDTEPSAS